MTACQHGAVTASPQQQVAISQLPPSKQVSASWHYIGPDQLSHGPFTGADMLKWTAAGYFADETLVRTQQDANFFPLAEWKRLCGGQLPFGLPVHSFGSVAAAQQAMNFPPPGMTAINSGEISQQNVGGQTQAPPLLSHNPQVPPPPTHSMARNSPPPGLTPATHFTNVHHHAMLMQQPPPTSLMNGWSKGAMAGQPSQQSHTQQQQALFAAAAQGHPQAMHNLHIIQPQLVPGNFAGSGPASQPPSDPREPGSASAVGNDPWTASSGGSGDGISEEQQHLTNGGYLLGMQQGGGGQGVGTGQYNNYQDYASATTNGQMSQFGVRLASAIETAEMGIQTEPPPEIRHQETQTVPLLIPSGSAQRVLSDLLHQEVVIE